MDKEFYNSYNNLFYSQDEFNRIYRMVENNEHRNDNRLKYLRLVDGLLFCKDRKKELRVVSKLEIDDFLEEIYSKIETYGLGINKMTQVIQSLFLGITRKDIMSFLRGKPKFQLNQPLNKSGINSPVITKLFNFLWQADHMYMTQFPDNRYKYILTCIDHFSKHAWAVPVTSLDSEHTIEAFRTILSQNDNKKPRRIQVDGGLYKDKNLQRFMEDQGISLKRSSAYSPTENGLVENFNRQLRLRLYSLFIHNGNKRWKDSLVDLVKGWNETTHGTTKYAPNKIHNKRLSKSLRDEIIANTKKASKFRKQKPLEVGQWVRISTPAFYSYIRAIGKNLLQKKLLVVKWTPQKFEIVEIIPGKTDMQNDRYKLRDENNKMLDKAFFKSDLKLTTPYNRRDARRGIYSYSGVKDLDIKLNPKSDQAPVERIVNDLDRPPRQSQRRRRPSVRLPGRPVVTENREINVPPPEPRVPRRSKKKYKIDDFQIGNLVDIRYEDARNVYDIRYRNRSLGIQRITSF